MRNLQRDTALDDGGLNRDAAWLADLIETYRAGDIDTAVENLEWLLGKLKRACKARRALARAPERQLREALELLRNQAGVSE